jgi:hypothetical protein
MSMLEKNDKSLKIIILWAFLESIGGGILHGLKFPFTGWLMTAVAMWCLNILTYWAKNRQQVGSAVLIVMTVKLLLAPQTPFTAFFAVGLQGFLHYLSFSFLQKKPIGALSFTIILLCFLASAFQKIIVLTIFFGNNLWYAINEFGKKLPFFFYQKINVTDWLLTIYIGIYLIGAVGCFWLLPKIHRWLQEENTLVILTVESTPKRQRKRQYLYIVGIVIFLFISYGTPLLAQWQLIEMLLRFLSLYALFYLFYRHFLQPFLSRFFNNRVDKNKIAIIIAALPDIEKVIFSAWFYSKNARFPTRFLLFIKYLFQFSLR